tara:strand:- start:25 stop:612 length:588 start_codon:yes stop_codon:yes gene_type:complete
MGKRIYTENDMKLILDASIGAHEVADRIGVTPYFIYTERKKNNIHVKRGPNHSNDRTAWHNRETRSCIGENCNKSFKVVKSHSKKYCSRSCFITHNNPAHKRIIWKPRNPNMDEYRRYSNTVHKFTRKTYNENKEIINPENRKRALAGTEDGWQLDHIITIREGFNNNIPPEDLAKIGNLRMLPWRENLKRNRKK